MNTKGNLQTALLAAFSANLSGDAAPEVVAHAVTDILCAFAEVIASGGPKVAAPAVEQPADALLGILAQLRRQTALLERLVMCTDTGDVVTVALG